LKRCEPLEKEGYQVAGKPRVTGDGYYESVILDPDGNIVELTV
jgi:lactoylglutathione lyase